MLEIDHVIFTVRDFDAAAQRILDQHGLASVPGGSHPGHGTGNRIIPLGPNYIELMAVIDESEAAGSPLGRWVLSRRKAGDQPAALCLRTPQIASVAGRLGVEPLAMSRRRPDGTELSWHLAGLGRMLDSGYPFFIQWHVPPEELPGRSAAAHTADPTGIRWVEVGGDVPGISEWIGKHDLDLRITAGPEGVRRVGVGTAGADVVL